jgi:hypothetical protein
VLHGAEAEFDQLDVTLQQCAHLLFNTTKRRTVTVVCRVCNEQRRHSPGRVVAAIVNNVPPVNRRAANLGSTLFVWWQPDSASVTGRRMRWGPVPSRDETVRVHCPKHGYADLPGCDLLESQRQFRARHKRQYLAVIMHR